MADFVKGAWCEISGSPAKLTITLLLGIIFLIIAYLFLDWAVFNAVFIGEGPDACFSNGYGACWLFVRQSWELIFFGTYPADERWRPALVTVALVVMVFMTTIERFWSKELLWAWAIVVCGALLLMAGSESVGMPSVQSTQWGGLPLSLGLSVVTAFLGLPLAILLAIAQTSSHRPLRQLSFLYVETVRGLPLIAILFMASVIVPFLLPEGWTVNALVRAQIALLLFETAYLSEVVRAGLVAIPKGQYEAAASLGLSKFNIYRHVMVPQALRISIPALVNTFIDIVKDTTLVVVIGLVDVVAAARGALANGNWRGFYVEAFLFVAVLFFIFCWLLSNRGRALEHKNEER